MKKLIEQKLSEIQLKMDEFETVPLYYLKTEWQILNEKRTLLAEILQAAKR